jgi:hypothetical protein
MEPEILRRGKEFHRRVRESWLESAEGAIHPERSILLTRRNPCAFGHRRGRLDLLIDEVGGFVAVVEVKSTHWDSVRPSNRRKLMSAHRRQVWRYIDEFLDVAGVDVCPGVIYPSVPLTPGLREDVETYLNDRGLQVVWFDD